MNRSKTNILIVDQNDEYFKQLKGQLEAEANFLINLFHFNSFEDIKSKLHKKTIDLIMIDVNMKSTGLSVIGDIQKYAPGIPIIVLSNTQDVDISVNAIRKGAQDFLFKGILDNAFLFRAIKHSIERNILRSKLESLNALKDEFLSIVSHDIKGPIGVIKSTMNLFLDDGLGKLSEEQKDFLKRCERQAGYALDLISDLLDLGKIENGFELNHESFYIKELVSLCIDNYSLKLKDKKIKIKTKFEKDFEIYADPARISQVVNNLLSNALKFTPENGTITVNVSKFKGGRQTDNKNSLIRIAISDTGPGIPKDKLEKIFDKYEQARNQDSKIGTGLGLAICKQICKLHKGNIWAESEEGEGSTFYVFLPHIVEKETLSSRTNHEINILIFNNNQNERKSTKQKIQGLNFNATDVEISLEKIADIKTMQPDLLIVEIDESLEKTLEFLDKIRSDKTIGEIPIIISAKLATQSNIEEYFRFANDLIFKPVESAEYEYKIRKALNLSQSDVSLNRALDPDKKTILLVDDDDSLRHKLAQMLEGFNVNILKAKNGVEALFLQKKYSINLILSDISMPVMDGIEMAQHFKDIAPEIPLVFLTQYKAKAYEKASKTFGAVRFITKPVEKTELENIVNEFIH